MVLDFRPKDQPKPWYSRLGLRAFSYAFLAMAVTVSLIAREFRRPQPFGWLVEGGLFTNPVKEEIDTRVPVAKKTTPVVEGEDVVRIETIVDPNESTEPELGFFPGVKPALLTTILDGAPHRPAERDAYYSFMKILKEHDSDSFRQYLADSGKDRPVAFAQLFRQSNHYRGHLVRLKCKAHSCIENKFGKNPWGLEKYYHMYLESSEGHLMQANVLEIPEGFPVSTVDNQRNYSKFDESIELVGFFYKLIPYPARDDLRNSPLIFARSVQWTPPTAAPADSLTWTTLAMVLVGGMAVGLTFAFFASRQAAVKTFKRKHGPPTQAEIAALGRLGEAHRQSDGRSGETNQSVPVHHAAASDRPEGGAAEVRKPDQPTAEQPTDAAGVTGSDGARG